MSVTVDVIQDEYGSETTWEITNSGGTVIASGGPYTDDNDQQLESTTVCLELDQCYDFTINDSYGDGICCEYCSGSYNVHYNGVSQASGGEFTDSETTNFCLTAGLNENILANISVYPNPTNGTVTVDLSKIDGNANITVTSTTGAIVAAKSVTSSLNQFDLSREANGLYFIEVVTESCKAVYKLNLSK